MYRSGSDRAIPLDSMPLQPSTVLFLVDHHGTIQHETATIEPALGYDQGELVGTQLVEKAHPGDRDRVAEMLQALTAGQSDTDKTVEYRHKTVDGSYVWVTCVGSTDPTPEGDYVITLTTSAGSREPSQSDTSLYEFAKILGHDLRNPLNVASGNVQLLYEEIKEESARETARLAAAMRAHKRMDALIQDLLALAQSGDQINDIQWVDLSSLCETSWQHVPTANATLVIELSHEIHADRSRLQQLLENLIRNSVEHGSTGNRAPPGDAIEHGGEDVTITIGALSDKQGFYIADDGVGIPPGARNRIFESGFSTNSDGTGFGLTIVEDIVDAHGWQIEVTESDAGGARFEISGVTWRSQSE